jgi:hypothetical protein
MMERATVKARVVDLAEIRRDAERRGISLSDALGELVGTRAAQLRAERPKPRFGVFNADFSVAEAEQVENPAARPFRT